MFFEKMNSPTVIPSDVWAYMEYVSDDRLGSRNASEARAYVDQAFEFFEAAQNPRLSSRPLLYYYSFLNLAKAFLIHRQGAFQPEAHHGIKDPTSNARKQRVRFQGQKVEAMGVSGRRFMVFPNFVDALGGSISAFPRQFGVVDLLGQVPGIHRTFNEVTGKPPCFCPIEGIDVMRDSGKYWVRSRLDRKDPDVLATIERIRGSSPFSSIWHRVRSEEPNEMWFETGTEPGWGNGVSSALRRLRDKILACGIWTIADSLDHRFYFGAFPRRHRLPQLASVYAIMYYLGSVTRYQPYSFDKIVKGGDAWLVKEFLETQPLQFLYNTASLMSGSNVVMPIPPAQP